MQLPRAFTFTALIMAAAVDPALAAPLVLAAGPSPAEACANEIAATDSASPRLKRLCDEAITEAGLTDRDRAAALANAGTARRRLGELDAAVVRFEEARELAPELEDISISQSAALIRLGGYEEAIGVLHQPGKISPDRRAFALYNRAMASLALDAPGPALADLEEALRLKPDYAAASALLDEIDRAFGEAPGA